MGALLAEAKERLRAAGKDGADLDARLLLAGILGCDAMGLFLRAQEPVPDKERTSLARHVDRRLAGEPVHRILGRRAFYNNDFALSPDTLEPRPDTETLVDLCTDPIALVLEARGACLMADVGTGTGAIAISLLALFPGLLALGIDIAPGALVRARVNAEAAGVGARFLPVASDYLSTIAGPLDIVVSNPPYIPSGDIEGLAREVRDFDPRLALDGGADGLDAYRRLAVESAALLRPSGYALVEIGQGQASDVTQIFMQQGLVIAASANDLQGVTRALRFQRRRGDGSPALRIAGRG